MIIINNVFRGKALMGKDFVSEAVSPKNPVTV